MNGRPGRSFRDGFGRRHSDSICFKKPSKREATGYCAANAQTFVTHYAAILIGENNMDAKRLANSDESGITPGKETSSIIIQNVYCTRYESANRSNAETFDPEISNVKQATLMAVIFASGESGRPMFVLRIRRFDTALYWAYGSYV